MTDKLTPDHRVPHENGDGQPPAPDHLSPPRDDQPYLIFSQVQLDASSLLRAAQRLNPSLRPHQLELDVGGVDGGGAEGFSARLLLRAEFGSERGEYLLSQRAPSPADQAAAQRAELSGKAYGMAQLSARCPWLWVLSSAPPHQAVAPTATAAAVVAAEHSAGSTATAETPVELLDSANSNHQRLTLLLCALFAGVALGPVMPPGRDTLFGVRGARERSGF